MANKVLQRNLVIHVSHEIFQFHPFYQNYWPKDSQNIILLFFQVWKICNNVSSFVTDIGNSFMVSLSSSFPFGLSAYQSG